MLDKSKRAAIVLGIGVFSHWILDVISHRADMPIGFNGPYIGLELWASHVATLMVEGSMFIVAVWMYMRVTHEKDRIGRWALAFAVGLLAFFYGQSLFGPPPPSILAVAISGIVALVLFMPLFWWIDRHREVVNS